MVCPDDGEERGCGRLSGRSKSQLPGYRQALPEDNWNLEDAHRVVGSYMMTVGGQVMFIADATINIHPDARTLAEIAVRTARVARRFGVKPRSPCFPSLILVLVGSSGPRG